MTSKLITCLSAAIASGVLASCTTTTTKTTADTAPYDQTKKRVYTQSQMQKTGETNPGTALEKLDPSVRISGSRN
jgi:outer membrane biogenesis lipoprotein LolB